MNRLGFEPLVINFIRFWDEAANSIGMSQCCQRTDSCNTLMWHMPVLHRLFVQKCHAILIIIVCRGILRLRELLQAPLMLPDAVRCVRDEIWSSVEGDYTWHHAPSCGLTERMGDYIEAVWHGKKRTHSRVHRHAGCLTPTVCILRWKCEK
jgi:hypothetical protein